MSEIATELQTSYEVEKNLMILNGYNAGTIEWEQSIEIICNKINNL